MARIGPHERCFSVSQSCQPEVAVTVAEIAVEKGPTALLCRCPVAASLDLSDDMATRIDIQFCTDARDALQKATEE